MDRYRKLGDALKGLFPEGSKPLPLFNAEVVSIEGQSCTIRLDELEIDGVRLKATINESGDKLLLTPPIGSMVLVGSLSGDFKDLAVVSVDQFEKLEYQQSGLNILIDGTDGKIAISNDSSDLKGIFQSLADLLKQFKVYTANGPSGTPIATTMQQINAFETDFKNLLK
jgi:hypothetical protein